MSSQQDIESIIDQISSLNNQSNPDTKQLEILQNQLHLINLNLRMQKNIENMSQNLFENNQTLQRFETFLESRVKHALITAPTQVGKTNAVLDFIKECIARNIIVIVSSDNKTDQQEQMITRLRNGLLLSHCLLIKASDKKFAKQFQYALNENLTPIIFSLDNSSQIVKIRRNIIDIMEVCESTIPKTIAIVHDEGDVVTRGKNTYENLNATAQSHKAWVNLIKRLEKCIDVKRVFVSATPENCVVKYNIESPFIIRLEIPNNYISYENIEWQKLPKHPRNLKNIIQKHIDYNKHNNDFSAILYITDRKIINHEKSLDEFSCLSGSLLVHTYNSSGISFKIPENNPDFVRKIKESSTKIIKSTKYFMTINISIDKFYQIVKDSNIHTVLTIGMDMISRGISFVSEKIEEKTMAASVMIYNPSKTLHNVAINQTIGRLTGTARPDLPRILYSVKDVYDNYLAFNQNQKQYLDDILSNSSYISSERMKEIILNNKLTRDIDRKKLKLAMNFKDKNENTSESSSDDTTIDGVKMSNLKRWCHHDCNLIPAKIIRFLLSQPNMECDRDTLIRDIGICYNNIQDLSSHRSNQGFLITNSQLVQINPNILPKIQEFMKNQ